MTLDLDPLEQVAELFKRILLERKDQEARQPVVPPRDPETLRDILDLEVPDRGQDLETVGQRLRKLVRHTPTTASGSFFNQLFGGRQPASLLGETVAAALNNSMYTFKVAGAQVLVEMELIHKMGRLVGFEKADGCFTPGGSLSNLTGMLLARDRARPRLRAEGLGGPRLRIYTSVDSHYSVAKAVAVLGIGLNNVVQVDVDARGRMDPAALDAAIRADQAAGHQPMMVNATAGTTVLGAFDPLDELADVCGTHKLWLHVDGAYGGSAVLDPAQAHLLSGCGRADSMSWDAHKVMGAQLSCSVVLVRKPGLLARSLDANASYLFQEDSRELDPGTRSLQCGRRNDALKLWTLWQSLGNDGMANRLASFRKQALYAAQLVREAPGMELVREPEFLNVCFAVKGVSAEQLCTELTDRGLAMVGYALVDGEAIVRLVLVNAEAGKAEVQLLFKHIREVAAQLREARAESESLASAMHV
ncbi:MAG: glutamate/tyrosine decarboxylase-like PLP-dependent enzyme [Planctomycetota bacterium]|jgi:glutamate/tyrosine decarboxylase-like PLP-dependent enzyme